MKKRSLKPGSATVWKKGWRWTADSASYAVSILRDAASMVGTEVRTKTEPGEPQFAEKDLPPHRFDFEYTAADCPGAQAREIWASAQQVIEHKIDLLGSGLVDISVRDKEDRRLQDPSLSERRYRQINWHKDFRSGYEWHRLCMPQVALRTYRRHAGVDVKWPWELSRFQHLTVLSLASRMTSSDRNGAGDVFWREFRCQTGDWIAANPVGLGVNWACEMEVAIRAVNWVVALVCFDRQDTPHETWSRLFWGAVREHAQFLCKRLRRFGDQKKGNHYVAELAGLCWLGLLCPHIPESPAWLCFAKDGLEREIRGQVQSDGTHWEDSAFYHLLVTEMFLHIGVVADSLNRPFSDTYRRIVEKMVSVIGLIGSSRGAMPQIGDSDSGYFLRPIDVDGTHTRAGHATRLGRSYLRRDRRRTVTDALDAILVIEEQDPPCTHRGPGARGMPVLLEDSGWMILEQGPIKVVMCLGPANAEQRGGHAHDDALSISLFWDGVPVIVDPGAYVYTSDLQMRNRFRCANRHNQPQVKLPDEAWVHRGVFAPLPAARRVVWERLSTGAEQQGIVARLTCAGDNIRCTVSRKVILNAARKRLTVEDTFQADAAETLRIALCLHPDMNCRLNPLGGFALEASGANLEFESHEGRFAGQQGEYSSAYGCLHRTSWLICEQRASSATVNWAVHEK